MISPAQVRAGLKATASMEKGLGSLLASAEALVAKTADLPGDDPVVQLAADLLLQQQGGVRHEVYVLAQLVRAVIKTQKTQASYLRMILAGYAEPVETIGPVMVNPQVAPVPPPPGPPPGSEFNFQGEGERS